MIKKQSLEKIFFLAKENRFPELEKFLTEDDPEAVKLVDRNRNTLLHVASENGHKKLVNLLIDMGSDLNAQNLAGNTSLHLATQLKLYEIQNLLIERGASESIRNNLEFLPRDGTDGSMKM